jgi:5-(carboxyamino)imidazole ribonucleotide mutase
MPEKPQVAILMGSASDFDTMSETRDIFNRFNINFVIKILSAHRTPKLVESFVKEHETHVVAFICGAGMAAHLAGMVASMTTVPVLGVPMDSGSLRGQDALLSTVQMPGGIPVATFGIGKAGATNAALFVVAMLAETSAEMKEKLQEYRRIMTDQIVKTNESFNLR